MAVDRLQDLIAMSQKTPAKPLIWYGLAMEYRTRGQLEDALAAFEKCRTVDATFVPAWFQGGLTLDEAKRRPEAMAMLQAGIQVARKKGDNHAAGEMQGQLELWED